MSLCARFLSVAACLACCLPARAADPPAPRPNAIPRDPAIDGPAPPALNRAPIVRQALRPGQAYETIVYGTIQADAEDQKLNGLLGVDGKMSLHYAFEARVERHVVYNDGTNVVEDRYFSDVRMVKIGTGPQPWSVDFKASPLGQLALDALPLVPFVGKARAALEKVFQDIRRLSPHVINLVRKQVEADRPFGLYSEGHSLNGKAVRLHYVDGRGVTYLEPLRGGITRQERLFHMNSAVLFDCQLFPDDTLAVGEAYHIPGSAFGALVDPSLRARVSGFVNVERVPSGGNSVVLKVIEGRLGFQSLTADGPAVGSFRPTTGTLHFDPDQKIVVRAELIGTGELMNVPERHLLGTASHFSRPQIHLTYFCRLLP